jgi:hypothetical protein
MCVLIVTTQANLIFFVVIFVILGGSHRIMVEGKPDLASPFTPYYTSWFGTSIGVATDPVLKKSPKVCYSEIYFQPFPGMHPFCLSGIVFMCDSCMIPFLGLAWVWTDWDQPSKCSTKEFFTFSHLTSTLGGATSRIPPSPLFQSFNYYLRSKWEEKIGPLPRPPAVVTESTPLHVLVLVRKKTGKAGGNARYIRNMQDLLRGIDLMKGQHHLKVTVQDMAELTFREQVALAHSASIFIGR